MHIKKSCFEKAKPKESLISQLLMTSTLFSVSVTCRRRSISGCWDMCWQLFVLRLKSCGTVTSGRGVNEKVHLCVSDRHKLHSCYVRLCVTAFA